MRLKKLEKIVRKETEVAFRDGQTDEAVRLLTMLQALGRARAAGVK